jgi:hypothetical protein
VYSTIEVRNGILSIKILLKSFSPPRCRNDFHSFGVASRPRAKELGVVSKHQRDHLSPEIPHVLSQYSPTHKQVGYSNTDTKIHKLDPSLQMLIHSISNQYTYYDEQCAFMRYGLEIDSCEFVCRTYRPKHQRRPFCSKVACCRLISALVLLFLLGHAAAAKLRSWRTPSDFVGGTPPSPRCLCISCAAQSERRS